MNDQEILISTGKCWACNAGLVSMNELDEPTKGWAQCECPPRKTQNIDSIVDKIYSDLFGDNELQLIKAIREKRAKRYYL